MSFLAVPFVELVPAKSVILNVHYVPLMHPHSLRLLDIHPPRHGDPAVRCTLTDANLDEQPECEAPSHTWYCHNSIVQTTALDRPCEKLADRR
jgi:hypothetical protein